MKFDVKQQFSADAAAVIACYSSAELYGQLPDFGKISKPDLLDRTEQGDKVTLRLRYKFTADLPAAAHAIIDAERLTWVEETTYDLAKLTASTQLHPDFYASRLQASASARFADGGDGSTREVSGELHVKVLLVSGQVERAIVDGLKEQLAEEAEIVAGILA